MCSRFNGVVGAAAAWTIRAASDPVLFIFTHPEWEDIQNVGISAVLVFTAVLTAVSIPSTSLLYWSAIAVLVTLACYHGRVVLIQSLSKLGYQVRGVS